MSFSDKIKQFFMPDHLDQETLDLMLQCDTLPHNSQGAVEGRLIMETLAQRGYFLIEQTDGSLVWQHRETGRNVRYYLGWIRHRVNEQ